MTLKTVPSEYMAKMFHIPTYIHTETYWVLVIIIMVTYAVCTVHRALKSYVDQQNWKWSAILPALLTLY